MKKGRSPRESRLSRQSSRNIAAIVLIETARLLVTEAAVSVTTDRAGNGASGGSGDAGAKGGNDCYAGGDGAPGTPAGGKGDGADGGYFAATGYLATNGAPEIRADPGRIAQVLDNLVSNAVKFTPKGGSVNVVVDGDENTARLVVSDSGFGIPADEQEQVFSRFFRARNAMENAIPGTGLGLAITKALVERHGGQIALASEENGGTRVTVTLPV